MNVRILEKKKDMLKLEVGDLTLVNLLNENIWKQKIDYAACTKPHPYLSKPILVVKSKNPRETIISAAKQIIADAKTLQKQISKA